MVVADTGDIAQIRKFRPVDATTNPSLLLKAVQMPEYAHLIPEAVAAFRSGSAPPGPEGPEGAVMDLLSAALARDITDIVPGRVSIEVDARLSHDEQGTYDRVHRLLSLLAQRGVDKVRRPPRPCPTPPALPDPRGPRDTPPRPPAGPAIPRTPPARETLRAPHSRRAGCT